MQGWRRRVFLVLLVYVAAMLVWASRTWTDTQALVTPPGIPPAFAKYECPAVFGGGPKDPAPSEETPYAPAGTPCDEQAKHRVLLIVDITAAGIAMALLQRSGARHRAATELENARTVEPPGA